MQQRRARQRFFRFFVFSLFLSLLSDFPLPVTKSAAAATEPQPDVVEEQELIEVSGSAAGESDLKQPGPPPAAANEASPEPEELLHAQEEDVFAIPREEDLSGVLPDDQQHPAAGSSSSSSVVRNVISVLLTAIIVFLSARIIWDVMNFVGDVPDPFAHVQTPEEIPQAIDDLLNKNTPLAFVIRRCKFCGLGIRLMKSHGLEPTVVMIEGHRFQQAIRQHLRSQYHVRGLPYFFISKDEHGYLSAIRGYLQNEH